jgi:general secretion pathway protein C
MKIAAAIPNFDSFTLQRLLRKHNLELIIRATKLVLAGLAFVLLVALITEAITVYLNTVSVTSNLSQGVEAAKMRAQVSKEAPVKKADLTVITKKNILGPLTVPTPPGRPDASAKLAPKTPLNLIGTYVTSGESPYAIIEDDKKKIQDVFGLGELVFGEAKVVGIESDRVELDRSGQREILTLDDTMGKGTDFKGGIAALDNDRFVVEEAEIDRALENLPMLLTQARAVPYFRDGKATGLRLFAVKSGSLYEKLGLRNGDILKTINGNSLADLSQAMQLFERLKSERSISITLERNSEDKDFKYDIR